MSISRRRRGDYKPMLGDYETMGLEWPSLRRLIVLVEIVEKNNTHIMKSIEDQKSEFFSKPVKTFAIRFATTKPIYAHSEQNNISRKQSEI